MVEKKVKKVDPKYYIGNAVEKKNSQLFSNAKTRGSEEIQEAKSYKKKVTKEEKKKLSFTQFDVTKKE